MNNDAVISALSHAFDEGYSSPYEMKASIVDQIAAELVHSNQNPSMKGGASELANNVYMLMPSTIKEWLSEYDIWLCGGGVLRLLIDPGNKTGSWKVSDYDLYGTPAIFKKIRANEIMWENDSGYEKPLSVNDFKTYRTYFKDYNVNFMVSEKFTTSVACTKSFDLSIVKFAFSARPKPSIVGTRNSWEDLFTGQIRLSESNVTSKTVNRVKKYVKRGFRDATGLIEHGVLRKYVSSIKMET